MKGNLKQRLVVVALCIAMIITSVNLTELFNNNINAYITSDDGLVYFDYTGNTQSYTIPTTGYYLIELAGSKGADSQYGTNGGYNSTPAYYGGHGGIITAKIHLEAGTVIYVNVGSYGNYSLFNGAGKGLDYCGTGGGATDIRVGGTALSNRIAVAGGGGGASYGYNGLHGGAATSGNNGVLGQGSSASGSYGGGGGGGYYGGTSGANSSVAAKGGSNYFNTEYGTLLSSNATTNNSVGYASIKYLSTYSVTIKENNGNPDKIYTKSGSSTSITSSSFGYTGGMQSFTVPKDGIYSLQVYGAQGGASNRGRTGGYGGYSTGKIYLTKGTVLYIAVGGSGSTSGTGGWNGGGNGGYFGGSGAGSYDGGNQAGGGGGATHIAYASGLLKNVSKSNLLIVAGGGGGASTLYNGGAGGGTSGSKGAGYSNAAGTQTSGYAYGQGGSISGMNNGGGGGGLYGGHNASHTSSGGGSGGSGYLNPSLTNASTTNGQRSGSGYAVITYSDEILLPTPTKSGYTFAGWKITAGNGTISNNYFSYGTTETVVEAQWTKNSTSSTLVVNPNGGIFNDSKSSTTYIQDANTTLNIPIPEREGYDFAGWTKSSTFYGTLSSTTTAATYKFGTTANTTSTLTASWTRNTHSLTINPNTGLYNNSTNTVVMTGLYAGDNQTINIPTKKGHTFNSWSISGVGSYFKDANTLVMGNSDVTLTAKYDVNTYILTVMPNGGAWNNSETNQNFSMDYNTTKSIPLPTRTGYLFSEWQLTGTDAKMSSLTNDSTFTMGTSNATLKAIWALSNYKIEYDLQGGTAGTNMPTDVEYNTTISVSNPTKTGYIFSGWKITGMDNGSTHYYGSQTTTGTTINSTKETSYKNLSATSGTVKFTAQWTPDDYNITYNLNGGSVSGNPTSYNIETPTITLKNPTKVGHTFKGWTGSNGTTSQINVTIPQGSMGDKNYTANWTINKYNVTYVDMIKDSTTELGRITKQIDYNTKVAGSDIGSDTTIGKYYYGYQYDGCTSTTVGTSAVTVYRYFVLRTTDYQVVHQQQQLDGNYKTVETERFNAQIGSSVTPNVKTYEGFTSPSAQTVTVAQDGTTVVTYKYSRNEYTVTYIDVVDSQNGTQLGKTTGTAYYGSTATGATQGTNQADNAYYKGYYYTSATTAQVTTSGATVYRIFKLRTIDINGSVNWNDKSNAYDSRPSVVTVYLYRDGNLINQTAAGLVDNDTNNFSFTKLQKYDTATGKAFVYTVSQSDVVSNHNPEEKYDTEVDTTGFNFTNTLSNSTKEDPEPEWVGFDVNGSIIWEDYNDKFGTRPSEIIINLYQNGTLHKTQTIKKEATGYSFVNLDKYDENLIPYTYQVEEVFTSKTLVWNPNSKQYEEQDAYTITVDGFDFTNKLKDGINPPVKPDHINTLTIKLDFNNSINWKSLEISSNDVNSFVTLRQMETIINDGNISYTSNYSGMKYNSIINENGVVLSNIPSGKYEIVESNDNTFVLEGIDLQTTNSISVVNENDKWYLIIAETNQNQTGTITLNLNADFFNGIDDSAIVSNLYSLGQTETAQVMMLSMFSDEVTVPEYVEPITYTITYKDCDVVDDTKYSENSEATLKDCEIEGFLGWSEDSEATEPQYIAGDTIKLEKDLILYPVIETSEQSSEKTTEEEVKEETSEKEETQSETETSNEIEESEENNDSVENSEEISDNEKSQNDNIKKEELSLTEEIKDSDFSE